MRLVIWEKIFEVLGRQETESKTCQFLIIDIGRNLNELGQQIRLRIYLYINNGEFDPGSG